MCPCWPLSSESPRGVSCFPACSRKGMGGPRANAVGRVEPPDSPVSHHPFKHLWSGIRDPQKAADWSSVLGVWRGAGDEEGRPFAHRDFDPSPSPVETRPGCSCWLLRERARTHTRASPSASLLFTVSVGSSDRIEAFPLFPGSFGSREPTPQATSSSGSKSHLLFTILL